MVAIAMPADRVDIRCPKCGRLQLVIVRSGDAVIEVRCRCKQVITVDTAMLNSSPRLTIVPTPSTIPQ
jgi:phage FluMu protein Com